MLERVKKKSSEHAKRMSPRVCCVGRYAKLFTKLGPKIGNTKDWSMVASLVSRRQTVVHFLSFTCRFTKSLLALLFRPLSIVQFLVVIGAS